MPDPLGFEFRKLAHEQNLGSPMDLALKGLIARVPLLDIKFFASSVMMQRQTGGNLGEILMRLSRIIRERFQLLSLIHIYAPVRADVRTLAAVRPRGGGATRIPNVSRSPIGGCLLYTSRCV